MLYAEPNYNNNYPFAPSISAVGSNFRQKRLSWKPLVFSDLRANKLSKEPLPFWISESNFVENCKHIIFANFHRYECLNVFMCKKTTIKSFTLLHIFGVDTLEWVVENMQDACLPNIRLVQNATNYVRHSNKFPSHRTFFRAIHHHRPTNQPTETFSLWVFFGSIRHACIKLRNLFNKPPSKCIECKIDSPLTFMFDHLLCNNDNV